MSRLRALVLLALFVGGIVALTTLINTWLVAVISLGIFAGHWLLPRVAAVLGALVVPVLALLAFDVVWSLLGLAQPPPLVGLVAAGAFIGLAAWVYLRDVARHPVSRPALWAIVVVLLTVVVPPVAYGLLNEERKLPQSRAVSQLDIIAVGGAPLTVSPPSAPHGWDVRIWTGRAAGNAIRWEGGPPSLRPEADHVLLLAPDGGSANLAGAASLPDLPGAAGETARWRALADRAAPRRTPRLVVLQSRDGGRLGRFAQALHAQSSSLQAQAGGRTLGDLALRAEVGAPGADEELALAAKHRPVLLFDRGERYRTPLNVDSALASGKIQLCDERDPVVANCTTVHGSADLRNGSTHLAFVTDELAGATQATTIYVHVRRDRLRPGLLDLDYWWYLPDNPANAARGALCGAGLVIPEITCFDHQSDWEGVTVVADPAEPQPREVHYAAHSHVVRYPWPLLRAAWRTRAFARYRAGIDTSRRPLVFVALGTHASYPQPCLRDFCDEPGTVTDDNRHDGSRPWPGNGDAVCRSLCLDALPTHRHGAAPARWNAFDGYWGSARCVALFYCSRSNAPRAPGQQGRYKHPWCYDRSATAIEPRPRTVTATPCR